MTRVFVANSGSSSIKWELIDLDGADRVRGGIVQRISENTTPATSTGVNRLMDHHLAAAKFYAQRMVNYICENSSLFPEYSTNNENQLWPSPNKVAGFGVVGSNPNRNNFPAELQRWPYRINP
jgi:hypothetical protein